MNEISVEQITSFMALTYKTTEEHLRYIGL